METWIARYFPSFIFSFPTPFSLKNTIEEIIVPLLGAVGTQKTLLRSDLFLNWQEQVIWMKLMHLKEKPILNEKKMLKKVYFDTIWNDRLRPYKVNVNGVKLPQIRGQNWVCLVVQLLWMTRSMICVTRTLIGMFIYCFIC